MANITALPQFSEHDIRAQFLDFLRANDCYPEDNDSIIIDANIHRYRLKADSPSQKSGAYCVYNNGLPAGWVRDWHKGITVNWHYDTSGLDKEQRAYFETPEHKAKTEAEKLLREKQLKEKQNKAADTARIRIETLREASENHNYLKSKNVHPHDIKIDNGSLAIPMRDIKGNIKSLQWIDAQGHKKFFPDAPVVGLFWAVGLDTLDENSEANILLGEGFATMAKIYELTGLPCVAGFSCYYLKAIAKDLHEAFPKCKIIVTADNDKSTEIKRDFNPGLDHARELVTLGLAFDVVYPEFEHPEDGSDWDDFALKFGDELSQNILNSKIADALIPMHIRKIKERTTIFNAQALRNMVFPPIKWAVEGFLPSGLSILAGGPKIGKSILALHLSLGVAVGGCVLGKIFVEKGNVLYLALEDTPRRLQERINGSVFTDECPDLSALDLITEIPRQHQGGLDYIRWWLETHPNARLVAIDTLQMFRKQISGKGSMYSEDYEVISEIKKIADTFDVAFLILHHLKKGMEGDWLSEISGSQGISGAADTIFSLKRERNSNLGTLHRTGRDVEEKDFIVKLDGYGWTLQGEAEQFTTPEWKRQILDFLKNNPTITPIQLADTANISHDAAKKNLQRLLKEGVIKKTGWGVYELSN